MSAPGEPVDPDSDAGTDGSPDAAAPDGAPEMESGIEVDVHVHFGMTGSFPLQLAELFFASDGVHLAEYGLITPLFGLGAKKHKREATAMRDLFDRYGVDEVLARSRSVTWLSYDSIERVVVNDGGRLGNPRVGVYAVDGTNNAYRIHDEEFDPDEFVRELGALGDERGFAVELEAGLGYRPRESLKRFFD
ncbi:hypothetical protein [Halobaculum gomorrense]|uniref:Uncharacterized protein n=1 Tax=Halobaculum gomorrense TaxID=43928 RepID=A0A1M5SCB5_9EURY|nr:hypothetical protein [Halobaculum gomorrense]SHH35928.1 hypothetical protein SAMN05443636_2408 [Halobaculum gomorrense]